MPEKRAENRFNLPHSLRPLRQVALAGSLTLSVSCGIPMPGGGPQAKPTREAAETPTNIPRPVSTTQETYRTIGNMLEDEGGLYVREVREGEAYKCYWHKEAVERKGRFLTGFWEEGEECQKEE